MEVTIAVVILGSMVTIAVLQYTGIVEKNRQTEAAVILHDIRKSELRYHQLYGTYTLDTSVLDIDWPAGRYFSYAVTYADTSQLTCRATRTDIQRPASVAVYTLQIDQDGNITGP
jgi:Tfp pilus assembly protein PilE